jgi:hypothetical protein
MLSPGQWLHDLVYVVLIIFFAYFYTAVVFNPVDVAENMKKFGGYMRNQTGPKDGGIHRPSAFPHHLGEHFTFPLWRFCQRS